MILPRRTSSLDKASIVFVADIVSVKNIPNPESRRQKKGKYQQKEKQGNYSSLGNVYEKDQ